MCRGATSGGSRSEGTATWRRRRPDRKADRPRNALSRESVEGGGKGQLPVAGIHHFALFSTAGHESTKAMGTGKFLNSQCVRYQWITMTNGCAIMQHDDKMSKQSDDGCLALRPSLRSSSPIGIMKWNERLDVALL